MPHDPSKPIVEIHHIFVNECWVKCPRCGHVNFHTVGPPGALIDKRPWGHRECDVPRQDCPGYNIMPAEDVKIYETLSSFKKAGGIPKNWKRTNTKMWRQAYQK